MPLLGSAEKYFLLAWSNHEDLTVAQVCNVQQWLLCAISFLGTVQYGSGRSCCAEPLGRRCCCPQCLLVCILQVSDRVEGRRVVVEILFDLEGPEV